MENNRGRPLVSVIVVTYRNFDHIEQTLNSVLFQDYPRMELVLADDGSENFPKKRLLDYVFKNSGNNIENVLVYTNEKNLGTVKSLNIAHSKCAGAIVIELAGDDEFYDSRVITHIVDRMERTGSGLLATTRFVINDKGEAQYYLPHLIHKGRAKRLSQKEQYELFVSGQFYAMFSGSAIAIRRDTFEQLNGYDEKYRLWEDGPLFEKYLRTNRIEPAYDIVQIKYRLGGISTGGKNSQLVRDMEIYNATDRISQLGKLNSFYKALTEYNIKGHIDKTKVLYPAVILYKVFYKISFILAEITDKFLLKIKA